MLKRASASDLIHHLHLILEVSGREIKSAKASLQVVLKDQVLTEEVLMTVLIEVEGILNSKPLGYATSDITDPDPITPNLLLVGQRDA